MSRTVTPQAYSEMIRSLNPSSRVVPFGTISGLNVAARSRGTSKSIEPVSVCGVFGVVPFRELPEPFPAASPRSYPRCSVS